MSASRIFQGMSLRARLTAGFAIILALIWLSGLVVRQRIHELYEFIETVYEHPYTVNAAALEAKIDMDELKLSVAKLYTANTPEEVAAIAHTAVRTKEDIIKHLQLVEQKFSGNIELIVDIKAGIIEWEREFENVVQLIKPGDREAALTMRHDHIESISSEIDRNIDAIAQFAGNKVHELTANALNHDERTSKDIVILLVIITIIGVITAVVITQSIIAPLTALRKRMMTLADGDLASPIPYCDCLNELGRMAETVRVFRDAAQRLDEQRLLKSEIAALSVALRKIDGLDTFAKILLEHLSPRLDAGMALFYARSESTQRFEVIGGYGCASMSALRCSFAAGEGLPGQCAANREMMILGNLPSDYLAPDILAICSGLGTAPPSTLALVPVLLGDQVIAVIEFAGFGALLRLRTGFPRAYLEEALPLIALNLESVQRGFHTRQILERTRSQAEALELSEQQLRAQTEKLNEANHQLHAQAESLRAQSDELRVQQVQLATSNTELLEKNAALERETAALLTAQAETEQRAVELALASRYKSEFLANMSHELRTPLNSLLILSKALANNKEETLTADQVESATIIHDSGAQLLTLINDLLDLAKVEAGKMCVNIQDVPLPGVADTIARRFKGMAQVKGLAFRVVSTPELPEIIRSDPGKLEQILNNLIGNAIKFTEHGAVTVTFGAALDEGMPEWIDGKGAWVAFVVTDTGIGIADSQLDRIFMAFEQGNATPSRRFGGTGLGLSIARKLARLLGGDILVRSVKGLGSSFSLVLPAPPPTADGTTDAKPRACEGVDPASLVGLAHRLVQVVDDDTRNTIALAKVLRARGLRALVAEDARKALAQLEANPGVDLVIMDIMMPDIDGYQAIREIRRRPHWAKLPIIAVTAQAMVGDREKCLEAGANDYLPKPVDVEALIRMIIAHTSG